jgi:hypothetical protein
MQVEIVATFVDMVFPAFSFDRESGWGMCWL